jgi:predicted aspartyl protease
MRIFIQDGLPLVEAVFIYQGKALILEKMLLDTGSVSTLLSADQGQRVGLVPAPEDPIREIRGVGGVETVFSKRVEQLSVGELRVENFGVEIGLMDYGIDIDGIVGLDFLTLTRALIDLERLEITEAGGEF